MKQPTPLISFEQLPDSAFIRARRLVGDVVPISIATIWRKSKSGEFPAPVRLSKGITAWRVGEVRKWLKDPEGYKHSQNSSACADKIQRPAINSPNQVDSPNKSHFSQKNHPANSNDVTELKPKPYKKLNQSSDHSSREKLSPAEHFSPGEV